MKAHPISLTAIGCWLALSAIATAQYAGAPYYGPIGQAPAYPSGPMNVTPGPSQPMGAPSTQMIPPPPGVPTGPSPGGGQFYSTPPSSYPPGYSNAPPAMSGNFGSQAPTSGLTPPQAGSPWHGNPQAVGPHTTTPNFHKYDHELQPFGNVFQNSGSPGFCADGSCGPAGCGVGCDNCGPGCGCGPCWFGGLSGLIMTRDNGNRRVLTTSSALDGANLLSTRDPAYDWRGGYEAKIGRSFGCSSAIEASYFYLDPFRTTASVTPPIGTAIPANSLITTCDFCDTSLAGNFVRDFYNNAASQSFSRRDEIHNVELNWLESLSFESAMPLNLTALAGARWIRFHEGTSYGTAAAGTTFGANGGVDSAFYDQALVNNFIGGQLGARGQYYFTDRLRFYATPKVGVGAVTVDKQLVVKRGDGLIAVDPNGVPVNHQVYKNDVGMLGQLDVGFSFQATPRLSTYIGYRGLGLVGVAVFEDNIPRDFGVVDERRNINNASSLILHGGVAGAQFTY